MINNIKYGFLMLLIGSGSSMAMDRPGPNENVFDWLAGRGINSVELLQNLALRRPAGLTLSRTSNNATANQVLASSDKPSEQKKSMIQPHLLWNEDDTAGAALLWLER